MNNPTAPKPRNENPSPVRTNVLIRKLFPHYHLRMIRCIVKLSLLLKPR